jgi:hypothetical protein
MKVPVLEAVLHIGCVEVLGFADHELSFGSALVVIMGGGLPWYIGENT